MHNHSIALKGASRSLTGVLLLAASSAALTAGAQAQAARTSTAPATTKAPLVGTLGPEARKALQPSASNKRLDGARAQGGNSRLEFGSEFVRYSVQDAPNYSRGGSTLVVQPLTADAVSADTWYPTPQPPVWRLVADEHPAQAWRAIDVDDVVCNAYGACGLVTTRVVARWVAPMRAYAFADRLGRVWRVE